MKMADFNTVVGCPEEGMLINTVDIQKPSQTTA
jgi:hypothetical protein